MKHNQILLVLLCAPISCYSMNRSTSADTSMQHARIKKKYEVTEKCAQALKNIDSDHEFLSAYFKGIFDGIYTSVNKNQCYENITFALSKHFTKDQDLLRFYTTECSLIDEDLQQHYAPATEYVKCVVSYREELCNELKKQLNSGERIRNSWSAVNRLFDAKLREEIGTLKNDIITEDAEWVQLAKYSTKPPLKTLYVQLDDLY